MSKYHNHETRSSGMMDKGSIMPQRSSRSRHPSATAMPGSFHVNEVPRTTVGVGPDMDKRAVSDMTTIHNATAYSSDSIDGGYAFSGGKPKLRSSSASGEDLQNQFQQLQVPGYGRDSSYSYPLLNERHGQAPPTKPYQAGVPVLLSRFDSAQHSPERGEMPSVSAPSNGNSQAPEPLLKLQWRPGNARHAMDENEDALRIKFEMQKFLAETQSVPLHEKTIHIYSVKHIDLITGKPSKTYGSLIHKHIIDKLPRPSDIKKIGCTTFAGTATWSIEAFGGTRPIEEVPFGTSLITREKLEYTAERARKCGDRSQLEEALNIQQRLEKVRIGSGSSANVTAKWMTVDDPHYLKLDLSRVTHIPTSDAKSDSSLTPRDNALREIFRERLGQPEKSNLDLTDDRKFATWVESKTLDVTNLRQVMEATGEDLILQQRAIDNHIGQQIARYLFRHSGFVVDRTIGNIALVHPPRDISGVQIWAGAKGKLAYGNESTKDTKITIQPTTVKTFAWVSVADFLREYFGSPSEDGLSDKKLHRATEILRGVEVDVATNERSQKSSYTIQRLAETPRTQPLCVSLTRASNAVTSLRFPDMPCVDVGTADRPFYFPAELCLIKRGQEFRHEMPLSDDPTIFAKKEPKLPKAFIPVTGDPYKDHAQFRITFVRVLDGREQTLRVKDGQVVSSTPVSKNAWASFQHEIGMRYNGVLHAAVVGAPSIDSLFRPDKKWLAEFVNYIQRHAIPPTGASNAVILAVPKSVPANWLSLLKLLCDAVLGVQCQIVSAPKVNSEYSPKCDKKMVHYSGSIVRNLFARDVNPGQPTDAIAAPQSCIIGIHVISFNDFRGPDKANGVLVDRSALRLISIVSLTSAERVKTATSHHIVRIKEDLSLEKGIAAALKDHMKGENTDQLSSMPRDLTKAALYISGMPTNNQMALESLLSETKEALCDHVEDQAEVSLIAMSTNTPFTLAADQKRLPLVSAVQATGLNADRSSDDDKYGVHEKMEAMLSRELDLHRDLVSKVFKQHKGQPSTEQLEKQVTKNTLHVVYQIAIGQGSGVATNYFYPFLERGPKPDILYLAEKASERGRMHVEMKQTTGFMNPGDCPYELRKLHDSLRGSFYYL